MKHASVVALALLALAAVASAQTISGCEDVSNADLISLQTGILTCLSVDLDNDNSVCPGTCSNALEEVRRGDPRVPCRSARPPAAATRRLFRLADRAPPSLPPSRRRRSSTPLA